MKKFLVLEKSVGGFFKTVFASDLLEYSTERSLSNLIQMEIMSVVENDYTIETIHVDSSDETLAYIEKKKLVTERRRINKTGQFKPYDEKKINLCYGESVSEYQLYKVEGKKYIYMLVNDRINFPNVFFYHKDGTKEIANWQERFLKD